ncbi:MAG: hypothetical protein R3E39_09120 [Anaerolineae bacterium]
MRNLRLWQSVVFVGVVMVCLLVVRGAAGQNTADMILYGESDNNGATDIYSVTVDGGQKNKIGTVREFGSDAGWSPDGRFIYMVDAADDERRTLTVVDVETNVHRTMPERLAGSDCSTPLWWSPDGQRLVYLAQAVPEQQLIIFDLTTGESQTIPDSYALYEWAAWSHDGRYVAFYNSEQPTPRLVIWDAQKQATTKLEMAAWSDMARWSPADDRIFFTAAEPFGNMVYDVTDKTQWQLPKGTFHEWSPDGRLLTIYGRNEKEQVVLIVFDVEANTPLTFEDAISQLPIQADVEWSASGRFLAVTAIDEANDHERVVYALDTSDGRSRRLVSDLYVDPLVWSPAGNWLVFASNPDSGENGGANNSLWLFDFDEGRELRFAIKGPTAYYEPHLKWSADGQYLTVRTNKGLLLFNEQTEDLTPLAPTLRNAPALYWSPRGAQLALSAYVSGSHDIYIFSPEDDMTSNLSNTPDVYETFLGWRGSQQREYLNYCGEG